MAEISLSDWKTEGLRFSAFVIEPIRLEDISLWEPLIGHPPAERLTRPSQQLFKEEGPLGDAWLSVEARANRIDWRLGHNPKNVSLTLPVVGPYNELQQRFQELMNQWATFCPRTNRLAYGAVLLLRAKTLFEVCSAITDLLPKVEIDPNNTADFQYRINRRRQSQSIEGGTRINRLATWSAGEIARIDVDLSSSKTPRIQNFSDGAFCRLELDINTVPELEGEIGMDIVANVIEELMRFGSEIVLEGDVA